jgi:LysM repeat protein
MTLTAGIASHRLAGCAGPYAGRVLLHGRRLAVIKLALGSILVLALALGCNSTKKTDTLSSSGGSLTDIAPPTTPTNTPVVTPTNDQPITPDTGALTTATPTGKKTYTVKKGDTLWGIASRSYGDGKQYTKIVAANPGVTPQSLKVGQNIVIP